MYDVSKMYSTFVCIFVYEIKRNIAAKICMQIVYMQKFVEMWDTFWIHLVCIHFVYINSDLRKVYIKNYVYNFYTKYIENVYK